MKSPGSNGQALIAILVTLAILSIVTLPLISSMKTLFASVKHVEIKGEFEQIRQYVRDNLSCASTFSTIPANCASGSGYIELKRQDGNQLIGPSATGTNYGNGYVLRASCPAGNRLLVEVKRQRDLAGTASIDPLTKKEHGWMDLFNNLPSLCGAYFGATPPAVGPKCVMVTAPLTPTPTSAQYTSAGVACPAGMVLTGINIWPGCCSDNWMAAPYIPPAGTEPREGRCAMVHFLDDLQDTGGQNTKCPNPGTCPGNSADGTCQAVCCSP